MPSLNDQEAEFFRRIERAPVDDDPREEHRAALREQRWRRSIVPRSRRPW